MNDVSEAIDVIGLDLYLPGCRDIASFHQRVYETNYQGIFTSSSTNQQIDLSTFNVERAQYNSFAYLRSTAHLTEDDIRRTALITLGPVIPAYNADKLADVVNAQEFPIEGALDFRAQRKASDLQDAFIICSSLFNSTNILFCLISTISTETGITSILLSKRSLRKEVLGEIVSIKNKNNMPESTYTDCQLQIELAEAIKDLRSKELISYLELSSIAAHKVECGLTNANELKGVESAFQTKTVRDKTSSQGCALNRTSFSEGEKPLEFSNTTLESQHNTLVESLLFIKIVLQLHYRFIPAAQSSFTTELPDIVIGEDDFERTKEKLFLFAPHYATTQYFNKESPTVHGITLYQQHSGYTITLVRQSIKTQTLLTHHAAVRSSFIANRPLKCIPVAGNSLEDINKKVQDLISESSHYKDLDYLSRSYYQIYRGEKHKRYKLIVVASNTTELDKELNLLSSGISTAFANNTDFKTPLGSYITANPLAHKGNLCYLYPGVGGAYLGLGHSLFQLFPRLEQDFSAYSDDFDRDLNASALYPKTYSSYSFKEKRIRENYLRENINAMTMSGICIAVLYTNILHRYFGVTPKSAVGYSIGETSMYTALDAWEHPQDLAARLRHSTIFTNKLYGRREVLDEEWCHGFDLTHTPLQWETCNVRASREEVQSVIDCFDKVYITIISDYRNTVIAGDPQQCQQLIERLNCRYLPLDLGLVVHCPPVFHAYQQLVSLYDLPLKTFNNVRFYSSSCYQKIPYRTKAIAHSLARAICEPVDYVRLINKAYADGNRLFVEVGAGQTCSSHVSNILGNKEHLSLPMNIKGRDEHSTIMKAMAKLLSHGVNVNLDYCYTTRNSTSLPVTKAPLIADFSSYNVSSQLSTPVRVIST